VSERLAISIALGTHNGARFVAEQVQSYLDQTRMPDELVLSDDASQDGTVDLVSDLVARAPTPPRLTVLRNPTPLGVARNFQQAILAATGEIIVLSDQDDVWHPGKLARVEACFRDDPQLLFVHSDARLVDADRAPLGVSVFGALEATAWELDTIHAGRALEVLIRRNLAVGATAAFRRALLDAATPIGAGWVHDEWLAIIAAALGPGTVDVIREELVDYRQHGANQIGARKLSLADRFARLAEPRADRNRRLITAATSLSERVQSLDVRPEARQVVAEKLAHERVRSALPAGRWRRLRPGFREWRTGRYRSSGRGLPDFVRDLVQPVGE